MIETRKKWQGQTVDAKFILGEYLGGSNNSAVFLTQHGDNLPQKSVIKLIPAEPASADRQLSLWRRAAQLSHPNLVPIFHSGRRIFQNTDMLYVVMEYQEENLSQILTQRPLTPAEARTMLEPVLAALVNLHGQGLAHGRIKPANILATGDDLKLSSDTLSPIGESRDALAEKTPYDAPESASAMLASSADVWSLGVTLVEALTLRVPTLQNAEHILPDSLPSPFLEIARNSLRINPARRWSIADIAACLNPHSAKPVSPNSTISSSVSSATSPSAPSAKVSAASGIPSTVVASSAVSAGATSALASAASAVHQLPTVATPAPAAKRTTPASPLAVPLSPVPPLPREQMPRGLEARPPAANRQKSSASNSRYLLLGGAVAVVLLAIFVVPKFFGARDVASPSAAAVAPPEPAKPIAQVSPQPRARTQSAPAAALAFPSQVKAPGPAAATSLKTASEKEVVAKEDRPISIAAPAAPPSTSPSNPDSGSAHGEVLDQVLPDVSQKARDTIHGKVRVTVRVRVDPAGNVSSAEIESSPSTFFGDLALQAARRWEFQSPEADGHSLPSEWLLRFEFTQTDTQVFPKQQFP